MSTPRAQPKACPRHGHVFDAASHKGCFECYRDAAAKARRHGPAAVVGANVNCPRHQQPFNNATHKGCATCYEELARRHEATAAALQAAGAPQPAAPQPAAPQPAAPQFVVPQAVPPATPPLPPIPPVPQPVARQPVAPQPVAPQLVQPAAGHALCRRHGQPYNPATHKGCARCYEEAAQRRAAAAAPPAPAAPIVSAATETYTFADQPVTAEAPDPVYARGSDFKPAATADVDHGAPAPSAPTPSAPAPATGASTAPNPYARPGASGSTVSSRPAPAAPGLALYVAAGLIFFTGTGIYMAHKAAHDAAQAQFREIREQFGDISGGDISGGDLSGGELSDGADYSSGGGMTWEELQAAVAEEASGSGDQGSEDRGSDDYGDYDGYD